MGDEETYLLKERNRVSNAHSPTIVFRKNLVFLKKLTNDVCENCVFLELCFGKM